MLTQTERQGPTGRVELMNEWARRGSATDRPPQDAERDFMALVRRAPSHCWRLHELNDNDDAYFRAELTHLIDAVDAYPQNAYHAFDFCWKALEMRLRNGDSKDGTRLPTAPALRQYALAETSPVVTRAWALAPQTAFRTLTRRIMEPGGAVTDTVRPFEVGGGRRSLRELGKQAANKRLWEDFFAAWDGEFPDFNARVAFLETLLKAGSAVTPQGVKVQTEPAMNSGLLYVALLNAWRNERTHGSLHSPTFNRGFSLKHYTLPLFCLNITYASLCLSWIRAGMLPNVTEPAVLTALDESLNDSAQLFGVDWNA